MCFKLILGNFCKNKKFILKLIYNIYYSIQWGYGIIYNTVIEKFMPDYMSYEYSGILINVNSSTLLRIIKNTYIAWIFSKNTLIL